MNTPLMRVACRHRFATALMTIAFGVLLSYTPDRTTCAADPPSPAPDTIATVDGVGLSRAVFDCAFLKLAEETVRFGPGIPLYRMWSYRLQALSLAVDEQLVTNEARAHSVTVSAEAVDGALDDMVSGYLAQFAGDADLETKLARTCASLGGPAQPTMTEAQFRPWLREWLRPRYAQEVKVALTADGLKAELIPLPALSEDDLRAEFATITIRTISIRYRPAERIEDAERESKERAEGILQRVRDGADFAELAASESDDDRYRDTAGLKPEVLLSSLNPDRRKAVASLDVGDVSQLIRTDRGYEIIRVEGRGHSLPPDYEDTRPQLRARLSAQRQEQAWDAHVKAMREDASVEVTDPELLAYARLEEGKDEEAIPLLETASQHPDTLGPAGAACVFFRLAVAYSARNRWEEATRAYTASNHHVAPVLGLFPDAQVATLLGLGHTYENLGLQLREEQPDAADAALAEAVKYYQAVGQNSGVPSHHDRIRLAFGRLGRPDLAEREATWLARYRSDAEARRNAIKKAQEPAAADGPGASD